MDEIRKYEITEKIYRVVETPENKGLIIFDIDGAMCKRLIRAAQSLSEGANHVHICDENDIEILRFNINKPSMEVEEPMDNVEEIKSVLNNGHIIEAIDRIHITICYIEEFLLQHPLILSFDEYQDVVQKAVDSLADLYQAIGKHQTIAEAVNEVHKKYGKTLEALADEKETLDENEGSTNVE